MGHPEQAPCYPSVPRCHRELGMRPPLLGLCSATQQTLTLCSAWRERGSQGAGCTALVYMG